MAMNQKQEARALNAEERELVDRSRHPALQELPDAELTKLVKLMRERRDKAGTQAAQRRREMRGKAAPKGATPSKADEGSREKVAVLATAMRRLNNEVERRSAMAASAALVSHAKAALAMKQAATAAHDHPEFNSRHARQGMRNVANHRPEDLMRPMERGRLRKAAGVAQAKRDGR